MGEEVTQLVISDDAGCGVEVVKEKEEELTSIDETDKAIPASINGEELIEKCEEIKTNCEPQTEDEVKKAAHKPQDISIEKSKKWYNISFIHRSGGGGGGGSSGSGAVTSTISCNSRSSNSCEKKNSDKMDKRHSWHLNDSAVVEM